MASAERPFLFCRYQINSETEKLNAASQKTFFAELQGKLVHHRARDGDGTGDTLLMQPRQSSVEGFDVLTWSVGHLQDQKVVAEYNAATDRIEIKAIDDRSVRYSDFVAVPKLGVLAVDDRGGELHLGGKQALNRLKSIIRSEDGMDAEILFEASAAEVRNALEKWSLTNFNFTIRPNNPRPVSRLAQELSEQMKRDGIGRLNARATPAATSEMQMSDSGLIKAVTDLSEAGYGQFALAGYTADGLRAEIKKPKYSEDRTKNEEASEKPRELRVYIETDGKADEAVLSLVGESLIRFYR